MLSSTAVEIAFVVERVHVSSTVEAVDEAMSGMVVLWVCEREGGDRPPQRYSGVSSSSHGHSENTNLQ